MRTSVPQMLHRYWSLTLRSSPASGGSGRGCAIPRSIPVPILMMAYAAATAIAIRKNPTRIAPATSPATASTASASLSDFCEFNRTIASRRPRPTRLPLNRWAQR